MGDNPVYPRKAPYPPSVPPYPPTSPQAAMDQTHQLLKSELAAHPSLPHLPRKTRSSYVDTFQRILNHALFVPGCSLIIVVLFLVSVYLLWSLRYPTGQGAPRGNGTDIEELKRRLSGLTTKVVRV